MFIAISATGEDIRLHQTADACQTTPLKDALAAQFDARGSPCHSRPL
jgi:hypothetical protein